MNKFPPFEHLLPCDQELIARLFKLGRPLAIDELGDHTEPISIGNPWYQGVWADGTVADPMDFDEAKKRMEAGDAPRVTLSPEALEACKSIDFSPKDPVRRFEAQNPRVESGPIAFGPDEVGIFIRGDEAMGYAQIVKRIAQSSSSAFTQAALETLAEELESCDVHIMKRGEAGI